MAVVHAMQQLNRRPALRHRRCRTRRRRRQRRGKLGSPSSLRALSLLRFSVGPPCPAVAGRWRALQEPWAHDLNVARHTRPRAPFLRAVA